MLFVISGDNFLCNTEVIKDEIYLLFYLMFYEYVERVFMKSLVVYNRRALSGQETVICAGVAQ